MHRPRFLMTAVLAGLLATSLFIALSAAARPLTTRPSSAAVAAEDVAGFAPAAGVDQTRAAAHPNLQQFVEGIGSELSTNPAVTSFWIDNSPSSRLTIGLRSVADAESIRATLPSELYGLTDFVVQKYSENDLATASSGAQRELVLAGIQASGSVDVRRQIAYVLVPEGDVTKAERLLQGSGLSLGGVTLAVETGRPANTIFGGIPMDGLSPAGLVAITG